MMVPVARNMGVSMADKWDLLKVTVADCTAATRGGGFGNGGM
jgi:hypothetical protein